MRQHPLFKLNRSRWFTSQIIEYSVDPTHLIYNSAHDCLENLKWNLCALCCHEINCVDCTKCNRIIVSSFVTHNTNGTHVSEGCEILIWHPCWSLAVSFLVLSYGLVNLRTVDEVSILNDTNLISCYLSDNSDSKSRTWEWLTEYKMFWYSKLKTSLTNLILEKVAEWLNDFLEINEIRKSSYIVVRLDYG